MDVAQVKAAAQQGAADTQAASNEGGRVGPGAKAPGEDGPGTDLARALVAETAGEAVASPNELRLKVDRDLDQVVATVVDTKSERVLRTIPPEELLEAAKRLQAALGQILNREV